MQPFLPLLVAVWREACRHIKIEESAVSIAELLRDQMPLRSLTIYRVCPEHSRLTVVASGPERKSIPDRGQSISPEEFTRLRKWISVGKSVSIRAGDRTPSALVPIAASERDGEWIASPLSGDEGEIGLAVGMADPGSHFNERHREIMDALREPLSVALENDARVHELAALREAAEAEKRSLLTRLGRKEIGDAIVGEGSGLSLVMERVRLIGKSDVPVLILGETGTGKELIARAIHNGSDCRNGPFIRVNCGAIPRELIDSQLFGHEKGSFTGAVETRQGWFERADGGTLFLDEIGELPADAQVRFLRVLQDGFVERIGGERSIHVHVRVVAATHRDLAEMVREGRFREDLWYRIAVFPILIPPLRDRVDDIPELVDHFARRAAARFSLAHVNATPKDIEMLKNYGWPGNIRELGAVIDRAAILGDGKTLEIAAALGFPVQATPSRLTTPSPVGRANEQGEGKTLDDAMRRHIEEALESTRGKIEGKQGAAARLGINPHTLRARMRKLGVQWQRFRAG